MNYPAAESIRRKYNPHSEGADRIKSLSKLKDEIVNSQKSTIAGGMRL